MVKIGIYEKALPKNITWLERLTLAKQLDFDFVEMSIDETDERLSRLNWSVAERQEIVKSIWESGVSIKSICLSGHRRYPLGSKDPMVQEKALIMMEKAIDLAFDLGVRVLQLAGYDVYYEEKSVETRENFIRNLKKAVTFASEKQVILAIEIMDDPFINSITRFLEIKKEISSPWLKVYPDLGNLTAWAENDVGLELEIGISEIVAIHLKDTLAVTPTFPGKFKKVPFGKGCVDFKGCFKTLNRLDYKGVFLIEMWSEDKLDFISDIQKAQTFLRPLLKEGGFCIDDE